MAYNRERVAKCLHIIPPQAINQQHLHTLLLCPSTAVLLLIQFPICLLIVDMVLNRFYCACCADNSITCIYIYVLLCMLPFFVVQYMSNVAIHQNWTRMRGLKSYRDGH